MDEQPTTSGSSDNGFGMKAVLGLAVLIVLVGGAYFIFSSTPAPEPTDTVQEGTGTPGANETGSNTNSGSGSFASLAGRSGNWECDIMTSSGSIESSGTVFVSDGKMRGDFSSVVEGSVVQSHMMQLDGFVYTWSNLTTRGFKMPVTPGGTGTATSQTGFSTSQNVSYDCSPWAPDQAKFVLPTSISFSTTPGN